MRIIPTPKPATLTAITILAEAFGTYAWVSSSLPARDLPERFVQVERVGGGRTSHVTDNARILANLFAPDDEQAEAMCATVCAAFSNAAGTTVTTTKGDVFVQSWGNEHIVSNFPHPDILERRRNQVHGDLAIKSN